MDKEHFFKGCAEKLREKKLKSNVFYLSVISLVSLKATESQFNCESTFCS